MPATPSWSSSPLRYCALIVRAGTADTIVIPAEKDRKKEIEMRFVERLYYSIENVSGSCFYIIFFSTGLCIHAGTKHQGPVAGVDVTRI